MIDMTELEAVGKAQALGHDVEVDNTMSAARRWTCTRCSATVLALGAVIYGSASERPCSTDQR